MKQALEEQSFRACLCNAGGERDRRWFGVVDRGSCRVASGVCETGIHAQLYVLLQVAEDCVVQGEHRCDAGGLGLRMWGGYAASLRVFARQATTRSCTFCRRLRKILWYRESTGAMPTVWDCGCGAAMPRRSEASPDRHPRAAARSAAGCGRRTGSRRCGTRPQAGP